MKIYRRRETGKKYVTPIGDIDIGDPMYMYDADIDSFVPCTLVYELISDGKCDEQAIYIIPNYIFDNFEVIRTES